MPLLGTVGSITGVLGFDPVLPGESAELYQSGLAATLQEMEAQTPLQIYLAEKIFDCLWWIRRYEDQKRATLVREMADLLEGIALVRGISEKNSRVLAALFANKITSEVKDLLRKGNFSMESLRQAAYLKRRETLLRFDEMVALKAKTLAGFQASYEVSTNRKLIRERMELQNALIRRDLAAIEYDHSKATPDQ